MSNSNPGSGGLPLRATAMVLIALAIVFAGLGAMSLSSADSDTENADGAEPTSTTSAPATTAASAPTTSAATEPGAEGAESTTPGSTSASAPTGTVAGEVDRATPVQVLNNSLVAGLAADTADQLTASGWTNTSTGNYAAATLPATTVYYGADPGDQEAATAVGADLDATVAPMIPGVGDGSGVVVVVTGR